MTEPRRAPWTREIIRELSDYQVCGRFHAYTCPENHPVRDLTPTVDGWVCVYCGYTQDWVHPWTADGSWRHVQFPS